MLFLFKTRHGGSVPEFLKVNFIKVMLIRIRLVKTLIAGVIGDGGLSLSEFLLNKGYKIYGTKRSSSIFPQMNI